MRVIQFMLIVFLFFVYRMVWRIPSMSAIVRECWVPAEAMNRAQEAMLRDCIFLYIMRSHRAFSSRGTFLASIYLITKKCSTLISASPMLTNSEQILALAASSLAIDMARGMNAAEAQMDEHVNTLAKNYPTDTIEQLKTIKAFAASQHHKTYDLAGTTSEANWGKFGTGSGTHWYDPETNQVYNTPDTSGKSRILLRLKEAKTE